MTWHEILAWALVGALALLAAWGWLRRPTPVHAVPVPPPPPEVPSLAEADRRKEEAHHVAEEAAHAPDPAAALHDAVRGRGG